MDANFEDRYEGQQADSDIPEDIIHLPERDPDSIAHIASPRLVQGEQVKDFEKQVIEVTQSKKGSDAVCSFPLSLAPRL